MFWGRNSRSSALERRLWVSGLALAFTVVLVPATAGCSMIQTGCWAFNASLARPIGGAKTPLVAAQDFVRTDKTHDWPQTGWVAAPKNSGGLVSVTSGRYTLIGSQGTDGTWFIIAGRNCH